MTAHDDRDPLPREEWREASSAGIRRMALQACEEAVRRAKEGRVGKDMGIGAGGAQAGTQRADGGVQ
jgi:hypothetical protein